jgi:hypothetical protein
MELRIRLLEADLAEARPEPAPVGGWIARAIKPVAVFVSGVAVGWLIAR